MVGGVARYFCFEGINGINGTIAYYCSSAQFFLFLFFVGGGESIVEYFGLFLVGCGVGVPVVMWVVSGRVGLVGLCKACKKEDVGKYVLRR